MLKTKFERLITFLKGLNPEAYFWLGGIIYLSIILPSDKHFSFCLFNNLGLDFCPGCGLGSSVSYLLHFNFVESFNAHPLGIPAFILLLHRIISLLRNNAMPFRTSAEINTSMAIPRACEKEL